MMAADTVYKNFGILAVILLFSGLTFLVQKWPQNKSLTFSQHAAKQRVSILYYICLFAVALPLLILFFTKWFVSALELSGWFNVFIIASSIAQFTCTLIPEIAGWRIKWHRALAGLSGLLLILPMSMLVDSHHVSTGLRIIAAGCGLVMVGIIGAASLLKTKAFGWPAQAIYFAAFFVAVLSATYLQ